MKKKGEIPIPVKFAKMNDGDEYNHAGTHKKKEKETSSGESEGCARWGLDYKRLFSLLLVPLAP